MQTHPVDGAIEPSIQKTDIGENPITAVTSGDDVPVFIPAVLVAVSVEFEDRGALEWEIGQ